MEEIEKNDEVVFSSEFTLMSENFNVWGKENAGYKQGFEFIYRENGTGKGTRRKTIKTKDYPVEVENDRFVIYTEGNTVVLDGHISDYYNKELCLLIYIASQELDDINMGNVLVGDKGSKELFEGIEKALSRKENKTLLFVDESHNIKDKKGV